jgi:hypothetical protein
MPPVGESTKPLIVPFGTSPQEMKTPAMSVELQNSPFNSAQISGQDDVTACTLFAAPQADVLSRYVKKQAQKSA